MARKKKKKEQNSRSVTIAWDSPRLKQAYENLDRNGSLRKSIDRAFLKMERNPAFGDQIRQKLIPKELRKKGIRNAFRVPLPGAWRLVYTLKAFGEIEVLAIILFLDDHKKYARKFRYIRTKN